MNEPSIESLNILVVNVHISLAMEYIYIYRDAFNILHFLDDVSWRIYLDGLTDLHVYFKRKKKTWKTMKHVVCLPKVTGTLLKTWNMNMAS